MAIVEIKNLWYKYRGMDEWVLKDISLEVQEGEFVIIMGPSGCGKSTLCYTLNGIIPKLLGGELKGSVYVAGRDVSKYDIAQMATIVGMVFQNPETQITSLTVEDEIAFGPENLALPREEIRRRVEYILDFLGMKDLRNRNPYALSGGQKQALAIASVLALEPKVLVLDEPTSMLDPVGQLLVSDIVSRLNKELKMTIIAVDHRVEWAAEHADRIIIMDEGRIVLSGEPHEVFSEKDRVMSIGFRPPQVTEAAYYVEDYCKLNVPKPYPVTLDEANEWYRNIVKKHGGEDSEQ
ncbi:MAG: energy-coupling factor ABC transporter ATP-binding protein [Candidatus Asgardarchaeia archaeon]